MASGFRLQKQFVRPSENAIICCCCFYSFLFDGTLVTLILKQYNSKCSVLGRRTFQT